MQWSWTLWLVKWAYVLTTTANDKKLCDNWLTTPKNSHTFLYHRKVEIQRKIFDDLPYPSYHTSFPQFKVRDPVINQQLWNLFGNHLFIIEILRPGLLWDKKVGMFIIHLLMVVLLYSDISNLTFWSVRGRWIWP